MNAKGGTIIIVGHRLFLYRGRKRGQGRLAVWVDGVDVTAGTPGFSYAVTDRTIEGEYGIVASHSLGPMQTHVFHVGLVEGKRPAINYACDQKFDARTMDYVKKERGRIEEELQKAFGAAALVLV